MRNLNIPIEMRATLKYSLEIPHPMHQTNLCVNAILVKEQDQIRISGVTSPVLLLTCSTTLKKSLSLSSSVSLVKWK